MYMYIYIYNVYIYIILPCNTVEYYIKYITCDPDMLYYITQERALSFGFSHRRAPCHLASPIGTRVAFRNSPQVRALAFGTHHRCASCPFGIANKRAP